MLKNLTLFLTVTALALNLSAAKDKKDDRRERKQSSLSYYTVENAPDTMEVRIRRGENLSFYLEENPTTGYVWEVKYDRKHCKVDLKQRASKAKRVGAPGIVEVKIKLNTNRDTTVELAYRRPFEKGVKPIKTIKCHIVNSRYRDEPDEPRKSKSDKKEAKQRKNSGNDDKQK